MPKPRIAILHYSSPPTIGGVESTIGDHARVLFEHGYAVKVVTGRGEAFDARVPVEVIPTLYSRDPRVEPVQRELARGEVTPAFDALVEDVGAALVNALAEVDVVIAHNVVTLHKNLALTVALKQAVEQSGVPLVAWSHDFAWTDPLYASELHEGMPWALLREPWHNARYIVVSEARRGELAELLGLPLSEIAVAPPGMDAAAFFQLGQTGAQWTESLDLLDAAPLLLLPARVTRRKNIELAIRVTAELQRLGLTPKLLVMGPLGPHNPANRSYLDELKALRAALHLDETVIFLYEHGAVDDVTRRDLYFLADALLFPSAREGFGIPMLEAGLARLPIFCADIPPFRESAGELAHYFGLDESPAQIAERMAAFFAGDARYLLKRKVLDEYTWEAIFRARIEGLLSV